MSPLAYRRIIHTKTYEEIKPTLHRRSSNVCIILPVLAAFSILSERYARPIYVMAAQDIDHLLAEPVDNLLADIPDPAADVEEQAWQRERQAAILRALQALPTSSAKHLCPQAGAMGMRQL